MRRYVFEGLLLNLFSLASSKDAWVVDIWDGAVGVHGFSRQFSD